MSRSERARGNEKTRAVLREVKVGVGDGEGDGLRDCGRDLVDVVRAKGRREDGDDCQQRHGGKENVRERRSVSTLQHEKEEREAAHFHR